MQAQEMTGRTIAIGDIHGCSAALRTLLAAIDPQPQDRIIALGDYVDRGPDSSGALDQLVELEKRCQLVMLLGNHEVMLLQSLENYRALEMWRECGGDTTLASYGGSLDNMPREHLRLLSRCRRYYETDTHFFVHANYDSQLPLDEQSDESLLWLHLRFRMPRPHFSGKVAVVGHTPQSGCRVLEMPHLICLDTCCYGDGCLSAMEMTTRQLWQVNPAGELLPPKER
jgi:serine/threonine protein phosphatase 1